MPVIGAHPLAGVGEPQRGRIILGACYQEIPFPVVDQVCERPFMPLEQDGPASVQAHHVGLVSNEAPGKVGRRAAITKEKEEGRRRKTGGETGPLASWRTAMAASGDAASKDYIVELLRACITGDQSAESQLTRVETTPGCIIALADIARAGPGGEQEQLLAAARVRRVAQFQWSAIGSREREAARQSTLQGLAESSDGPAAQFAQAIGRIARVDFPRSWPDPLGEVVRYYETAGWRALEAASAICKALASRRLPGDRQRVQALASERLVDIMALLRGCIDQSSSPLDGKLAAKLARRAVALSDNSKALEVLPKVVSAADAACERLVAEAKGEMATAARKLVDCSTAMAARCRMGSMGSQSELPLWLVKRRLGTTGSGEVDGGLVRLLAELPQDVAEQTEEQELKGLVSAMINGMVRMPNQWLELWQSPSSEEAARIDEGERERKHESRPAALHFLSSIRSQPRALTAVFEACTSALNSPDPISREAGYMALAELLPGTTQAMPPEVESLLAAALSELHRAEPGASVARRAASLALRSWASWMSEEVRNSCALALATMAVNETALGALKACASALANLYLPSGECEARGQHAVAMILRKAREAEELETVTELLASAKSIVADLGGSDWLQSVADEAAGLWSVCGSDAKLRVLAFLREGLVEPRDANGSAPALHCAADAASAGADPARGEEWAVTVEESLLLAKAVLGRAPADQQWRARSTQLGHMATKALGEGHTVWVRGAAGDVLESVSLLGGELARDWVASASKNCLQGRVDEPVVARPCLSALECLLCLDPDGWIPALEPVLADCLKEAVEVGHDEQAGVKLASCAARIASRDFQSFFRVIHGGSCAVGTENFATLCSRLIDSAVLPREKEWVAAGLTASLSCPQPGVLTFLGDALAALSAASAAGKGTGEASNSMAGPECARRENVLSFWHFDACGALTKARLTHGERFDAAWSQLDPSLISLAQSSLGIMAHPCL